MSQDDIKRFEMRMPSQLVERVDELAKKKGMTRNALLNEMADSYERFTRYDEMLHALSDRVDELEKNVKK